MGRIVVPYGVKGWINVFPFTVERETLLDFRTWWIGSADQAVERDVVEARRQGDHLVALLAGFTDREQVARLKGLDVSVPRSWLPAPENGEYYWVDLVGLEVANQAGEVLGHCVGFVSHGGHDVLRVQGTESTQCAKGSERLIPYVDRYVLGIDVAAGRITVDWLADW